MRFVDELRDQEKARALAADIAALCEPGRQYKFMEICGGHTRTIYKPGLEEYLPEPVTMVHGPGCPVCVIWRGLGSIPGSALRLREKYAAFDAEQLFDVPGVRVADPKACQCGEVLKGAIKPWECKVFGTACTPETPIGTCMVSSEGACAA